MHIDSNGRPRKPSYIAAVLAVLQWASPANAFHVKGVHVPGLSINSVTRQVDINIVESTIGTGSVHSGANVHWGDAVTSFKPWTFSTNSGGGGKVYAALAAVSHVYPDLI